MLTARLGRLGIALSALAIAAPSFAQSTTATPNFAGTWFIHHREKVERGHDAHMTSAGSDTASKQHVHADHEETPSTGGRIFRIIVTQTADSIATDRGFVDSTGKVLLSVGRVTYLPKGEWTGPYNSPPESTARTSMRRLEGGQVLELTTVATWQRPGAARRTMTTVETWRMNADGTARREWVETGVNARGEPTEQHFIDVYTRRP